MAKNPLYIFLLISLLTACINKPEEMVGPTIGEMDIIADESIRYIVEQEENIFERTYKHARLNISYLPEFEMFRKFMEDSIKVIMTTRSLTKEELDYFDQKQSHPIQTTIATGALAFITNKNVRDTAYTYEAIISMMKDSTAGKLFVIEDPKSGITGEIMRLTDTTALPPHIYALDSKMEVIDYVHTHDNAIGIIDWSEISDSDHQPAKEILNSVNLLGFSRPLDSLQHGFLKPYQYNLQDRKYPFTRDLYIISRTGRTDVSSGFASFIAGEIGQRIILKSGLLPKYQDERILEINNTSDIKVIK